MSHIGPYGTEADKAPQHSANTFDIGGLPLFSEEDSRPSPRIHPYLWTASRLPLWDCHRDSADGFNPLEEPIAKGDREGLLSRQPAIPQSTSSHCEAWVDDSQYTGQFTTRPADLGPLGVNGADSDAQTYPYLALHNVSNVPSRRMRGIRQTSGSSGHYLECRSTMATSSLRDAATITNPELYLVHGGLRDGSDYRIDVHTQDLIGLESWRPQALGSSAQVDNGAEKMGSRDPDIGPEPYAQLIFRALLSAPGHRMILRDIYEWFERHTDKARDPDSKGWQNSIRHNLSMNGAFRKVDQEPSSAEGKRGYVWVLDPGAVRAGGVESTTRYRKAMAIGRRSLYAQGAIISSHQRPIPRSSRADRHKSLRQRRLVRIRNALLDATAVDEAQVKSELPDRREAHDSQTTPQIQLSAPPYEQELYDAQPGLTWTSTPSTATAPSPVQEYESYNFEDIVGCTVGADGDPLFSSALEATSEGIDYSSAQQLDHVVDSPTLPYQPLGSLFHPKFGPYSEGYEFQS